MSSKYAVLKINIHTFKYETMYVDDVDTKRSIGTSVALTTLTYPAYPYGKEAKSFPQFLLFQFPPALMSQALVYQDCGC